MAVGNLVKRLQDIMRKDAGINGDAQRIEQMVWMFFLKVYDAAEEDWELDDDNFKSIIPEPLRWRNWAPSKDEEGKLKSDFLTGQALLDFINEKLFRVLKGEDSLDGSIKGIQVTRETARHQAVVRDVFQEVNQYMKNGVLLRQMIDEIDAVDLLDSEESHQFGDMYETLLKDLQAAGNAGEFYTPRPLTDFTVEHLDPKLGETMGDLAAGTGGFIISTLRRGLPEFCDGTRVETLPLFAWRDQHHAARHQGPYALPHGFAGQEHERISGRRQTGYHCHESSIRWCY